MLSKTDLLHQRRNVNLNILFVMFSDKFLHLITLILLPESLTKQLEAQCYCQIRCNKNLLIVWIPTTYSLCLCIKQQENGLRIPVKFLYGNRT